ARGSPAVGPARGGGRGRRWRWLAGPGRAPARGPGPASASGRRDRADLGGRPVEVVVRRVTPVGAGAGVVLGGRHPGVPVTGGGARPGSLPGRRRSPAGRVAGSGARGAPRGRAQRAGGPV